MKKETSVEKADQRIRHDWTQQESLADNYPGKQLSEKKVNNNPTYQLLFHFGSL